jgi:hypothetical protein
MRIIFGIKRSVTGSNPANEDVAALLGTAQPVEFLIRIRTGAAMMPRQHA